MSRISCAADHRPAPDKDGCRMRFATRRVISFPPRRPIGSICGVLLLSVCVHARAGDAPSTGVRLPAGGILEGQDPRLAEPTPVSAGLAQPSNTTVSEEPQGPSAATRPVAVPDLAPSPAGGVAERTSETRQILHRGGTSGGVVKVTGDASGTGRQGAETWRVWDALPLMIVLALIAAVAMVVRKYMPAKRLLTGAGAMDIVARLPLSGKQSLLLVKLGHQLVLVGVSPEQMASLAVIEDPEQVAAIVGRVAGSRPDSLSNSFADALGNEAGAYIEESEGEDSSSAAGGSVRTLLDKVRQLTRKQELA